MNVVHNVAAVLLGLRKTSTHLAVAVVVYSVVVAFECAANVQQFAQVFAMNWPSFAVAVAFALELMRQQQRQLVVERVATGTTTATMELSYRFPH